MVSLQVSQDLVVEMMILGLSVAGVMKGLDSCVPCMTSTNASYFSPRPSPTTVQFGNFEPSEDGNGNPTMLEGSYLAATSGGNDTRYLTEARVFYQDVRGVSALFHCFAHFRANDGLSR